MFTGIIEHTGTIEALNLKDDGGRVTIHAPTVAPSLAVSNSIAVNRCCLAIVDLHNGRPSAGLSGETIRKTSFGAKRGELKKGPRVNLDAAIARQDVDSYLEACHHTPPRILRLEQLVTQGFSALGFCVLFCRPRRKYKLSPSSPAPRAPPTSPKWNPSLSEESPGGT